MIHTLFSIVNDCCCLEVSTFLICLELAVTPSLIFNGESFAVLQDCTIVNLTSKDDNLVTDWEHTKGLPGLGSGGCGLNLRPTASFDIEAVEVIQTFVTIITPKNE